MDDSYKTNNITKKSIDFPFFFLECDFHFKNDCLFACLGLALVSWVKPGWIPVTYMSCWKLQSAFLMGFMLSVKISLHMRTILPDRSAASERSSNGRQVPSELLIVHTEVSHPRFQDLGQCYAYHRCEKSAIMAVSKVWKWERMPVGNGHLPSLPSTGICSRYLSRSKLNFWAVAEAKQAQRYKDNHVSPKGHLVLSFHL